MSTDCKAAARALLGWLENQELDAQDGVLVLGIAMSALIKVRARETGRSAERGVAAIASEMRSMVIGMRE